MNKQELIRKYDTRITELNKYIQACECSMSYYEKRREEGREGNDLYHSHWCYYMELVVECNTCYDILEDLKNL